MLIGAARVLLVPSRMPIRMAMMSPNMVGAYCGAGELAQQGAGSHTSPAAGTIGSAIVAVDGPTRGLGAGSSALTGTTRARKIPRLQRMRRRCIGGFLAIEVCRRRQGSCAALARSRHLTATAE